MSTWSPATPAGSWTLTEALPRSSYGWVLLFAVTGTELSKVTAAVKAKDSAVTVTSVRKDEDGSYDVFGTRAGAQVMLEVSKDLKTITARTGGPGGGHGHGPDGDGPGAPGGSTGSGTESNGTQSNGTASTTAFRTV